MNRQAAGENRLCGKLPFKDGAEGASGGFVDVQKYERFPGRRTVVFHS